MKLCDSAQAPCVLGEAFGIRRVHRPLCTCWRRRIAQDLIRPDEQRPGAEGPNDRGRAPKPSPEIRHRLRLCRHRCCDIVPAHLTPSAPRGTSLIAWSPQNAEARLTAPVRAGIGARQHGRYRAQHRSRRPVLSAPAGGATGAHRTAVGMGDLAGREAARPAPVRPRPAHPRQRADAAHPRAVPRAARARHPSLSAVLLAVGRLVHARRRPRRRDSVLHGAPAPGAARVHPDARGRGRHRRSGACASCATRPVTPSTPPTACAIAAAASSSSACRRRSIPEFYTPRPHSRSFVAHLEPWYAQSHPDEDFAETFAVWLTPDSPWRKRYHGWPALKKLEYVDALMREIGPLPPRVTTRVTVDPIKRLRKTLREHYDAKRQRYGVDYPDVYDRDLRRLFSDAPEYRANPSAARFIRRIRKEVRTRIALWTGEYQYTINQVIDEIEQALPRARPAPRRARGTGEARLHRLHRRADDALPAQRPAPGVAVKPLRILALMHEDLVPPDDASEPRPRRRRLEDGVRRHRVAQEARPRGAQPRRRRRPRRDPQGDRRAPSRTSCSTCSSTFTAFRCSIRTSSATSSCCASPTPAATRAASCWRATRGCRRSCWPTTASRCPSSPSSRSAATRSGARSGCSSRSSSSRSPARRRPASRRRRSSRTTTSSPSACASCTTRSAPTRSSSATSRAASSTSACSATSACRSSRCGSCCSPRCPTSSGTSPPIG